MEDASSRIGGLSVVVPVYNSASTLRDLAERLDRTFAPRRFPLELVLVNDGSEDASWQAVGDLARRFDWVRGVDLARNVGQHNALLCGIRQARHPVIVTIDDDLQHPPEEIPTLLAALGDDIDLVYGQPARHRHPFWRIAASWLLGRLARVDRPSGPTRFSAFRAFRTRLREAFSGHRTPFVSIDVLLSWSTSRIATVAIEHRPRAAGRSSYNLRKLVDLALDTLLGFGSPSPWLMAGLGLACAAAGAAGLGAAWAGILVAGGRGVGLLELSAVAALFAGLQLCLLAWFGHYLGRLYAVAIGRPPYVVARTTDEALAGQD
ncbi:undecaprenyl-phosphate 4-deoxy-4-formamido-L-arabinose transferase [Tistlia consotensis]|uniref:Undecaprenyl-phosphate 4-deoxy-4-formamido-L-arabinose transferase n=1 Tax=Tistlia consotensis USBA 355 TaxID=560819 RepID=A0A1Y6CSX7_9PROT|nr:glycosyltransferase family 2 protein [Tistlia consotensis]SMF71446.1 undecaprenyl-phosphate 4-deoxy-4-formamido-L-arabinose transferase [Tistlia consotensis USBA 355]SNS06663.1 undecaprenyl-phosphate 4-deoxy-4-formamido-L-arabinose transferase [Tistlia consotensis]